MASPNCKRRIREALLHLGYNRHNRRGKRGAEPLTSCPHLSGSTLQTPKVLLLVFRTKQSVLFGGLISMVMQCSPSLCFPWRSEKIKAGVFKLHLTRIEGTR